MAKLRVFISSTYYDLKHVRSYVSDFINKMGYEPTLSEKGRIAYDPDYALDKSCYRDAETTDIFVLIVGGRYGSATSETDKTQLSGTFYEQYESVTRKEFESAVAKEVPTYILVEKSVMNEYETFKKNRNNSTIKYAHVDSVNIFHFLDDIFSKSRNNPAFQFEQPQEIEAWLKNQWSGYFRTLLEKRSQNQQLNSLTQQVTSLNSINNSLQRYLEEVIMKVAGDNASQIIENEHVKITEEKTNQALLNEPMIFELVQTHGFTLEKAKEIFSTSTSVINLIERVVKESEKLKKNKVIDGSRTLEKDRVIELWKDDETRQGQLDVIRNLLGKGPLINDLDQ
ncbi:DUF4062 domain-containing protein [Vibrio campbellii]|uniref:DUF4062 domain-containing protein n=1 Tax=Vibrio campbellii TaxID=680 RepID=UPI0038CD525D